MSVLRQRQAEWNALVPVANARGIRIRPHNALPESIAYIERRLAWLRSQLGDSTAIPTAPTAGNFSANFTFGVELELIMPQRMTHAQLAQHITAAGVNCMFEGYTHATGTSWKIVTDGSLGDYSHGAEIVSPPLSGPEGFEALRKVCKVLTDRRCRINRRCGLHVHIGARNEGVAFFRNFILTYEHFQEALDSIMPTSRRGGANMFCQPVRTNRAALMRATNVNQVALACGQHATPNMARSVGRYRKVNLQSFWQHGTIEVRHHSGTVEGPKVENWVKMCLRIADFARQMTQTFPTTDRSLDALMEVIKMTPEERAYFTARYRQLNGAR